MNKTMKKFAKKFAWGIGVLVVLLAVSGYFLFANLDFIIKRTIEKYASAATQASVGLDSVDLQLTSGNGKLSGLSIGNPKGFSSAKAFYLGAIAVTLDTGSIRGTGPIVIKQIVVDKPQISYELLNSGTSNLQAIENNTKAYANSLQGQANSGKTGAAATATANPNKSQPGRKLIIDDLVISNGHVAITQELLKGKQLGTNLPTIHLTNIGSGTGGATAAQVTEQVISAIANAAAQSSVVELAKEKISGAINAVPTGAIGGAASDTIGNSVKGLFGSRVR